MINPSLKLLREFDARCYGQYAVSKAAFYVGAHPNTLRSWVRGRSDVVEGPVIPAQDPKRLSFLDIVSAHVLVAFRKDYLIPLQAIRRAISELRKHYRDEPYPLLNKDFRTDGKDLFLKTAAESTQNLSKHSQMMLSGIVDLHLDRIRAGADGLAQQFYPLRRGWESGEHKRIVMDPDLANGRPTIDRTGVPVALIYRRIRSGEPPKLLAKDYAIEVEDVEEAIDFYEKQAA